MNADRLLDAFSRLGDEPDTVQQFRKLVVALAISDKLVGADEAALTNSNLLNQIDEKKRALVQQGVLRKQTPLSAVSHEDLPKGFANPSIFVRLGEIARIEKGQTGIMKAEPGAYPLVVTAEERGTCDHFDFEGAAAIVPLVSSAGHGKASLQRLHYQEGKFALGSILAAIFPHSPELISARFLFEYLSSFKEELLVSQMIGTANVSLSVGKISEVPVPLIPPIVQRKVDELMDLCDRLEAAREAREATRDRLAAASLARLNTPDPDTFKDDARFALDALPALTTRPDQIKRLRQTILNLAVRGKLVPQDPNDEPASELLKRIEKEKARLVSSGEVGRDKPLPPLTAADTAIALPPGWQWARLGLLAKMVTSGSRDWAKHYASEGAIFVRMGNLSRDHYRLRLDHIQRVKAPEDGEGTRTRLAAGDILISITGEVGMLGLIPEGFGEAYINQHTAMVRPMPEMQGRYLPELFRSPLAQAQFNEPQRGIKNSFRLTDITQLAIPVPPLAEQHRIVAKVDELMDLCDRLEESLRGAGGVRYRLLEALLSEALSTNTLDQAAA